MPETLTRNITVDFSSETAEQRLKIETDDRDPSLRIQYLRVFPARTGVIFATTGTLTRSGNALHEVEEVVSFNNSNEVSLGYPNASSVSMSLFGSFYDATGNRISSNITYNATTNSLQSTETGFGVVHVTYTAEYTLYRFVFAGIGCPYEADYSGAQNAPAVDDPYEDSMIIVYEAAEGDYANVSLEGPKCNFKNQGGDARDSSSSRLILEVDKEGPAALKIYPRVAGAISYGGDIAASAMVRLYPDVSAEMKTTEGTLTSVVRGKQATQEDMINLTVSNGTSLKYPPSGAIQFIQETDFTDEWDRPLTAHQIQFKTEGATVYDVEWIGADAYTGFPEPREVKNGEVVVVNSKGYVVKVSGIVRAIYASTYRLFAYDFTLVRNSKAKVTDILDTDITALYEKQSGSIKLSGPSISGTDIYAAPDVEE